MKRQIRRGTFETNSSSVHSITMCPLDNTDHHDDDRYYTYDRFNEYGALDYETFEDTFTTENGDTVVAFGYYGHD